MAELREAFGDAVLGRLRGSVLAERYRIIDIIGRGGMGTIFRGEHTKVRRSLAIKVLNPALATDREAVQRFHREAVAAGRLRHQNIVEVIDVGITSEGLPFIVLELLEGENLAQVIEKDVLLPWKRIFSIMMQVCEALEAAHAAGIIHRDIKPENIFVVREAALGDMVKVLDFGIAKIREAQEQKIETLTRSGTTVGTPHYMSPEQVMGRKDVDHRTDVYSVGVVLYHLFVGRVPFEAEVVSAITLKIMTEEPQPPMAVRREIPESVSRLIMRAMDKEPARRFQSAGELGRAMKDLLPAVEGQEAAARGAAVLPGGTTFQGIIGRITTKLRLRAVRKEILWVTAIAGAFLFFIIAAVFLASSMYSSHEDRNYIAARTAGMGALSAGSKTAGPIIAASLPALGGKVQVRIVAYPPEAAITVDGIQAKENPFVGSFEKSSKAHKIVVQVNGYQKLERHVVFDSPMTLEYGLSKMGSPKAKGKGETQPQPGKKKTPASTDKQKKGLPIFKDGPYGE